MPIPDHSAPCPKDRTEEFVRLLNAYERRLAAYVMGLVHNWADAEEIVQEVRVRLWQQFGEYQADKDFGTWACTIAHYLVLAYRKRVGNEKARFSEPYAHALLHQLVAISDEPGPLRQALFHCLGRLTKRSREILRRYYGGQANVEQIAATDRLSASSIYKSIEKSRQFLYDCIREQMREFQP